MKLRRLPKSNSTGRASLLSLLAASVVGLAPAWADPPQSNDHHSPKRLAADVAQPSVNSKPTSASRWGTSGVDQMIRFQQTRQSARPATRQSPFQMAKHRRPTERTEQNDADLPTPTARWLRSTTSSADMEVARRLLAQASTEYSVGAWLSAETTSWDALRHAARAVDLAQREAASETDSPVIDASRRLQFARQAIREARDFSGTYGEPDSGAIARMARSHRTSVLKGESTGGLSAADASDRYLDAARVALAPIAANSVEAAQIMDLLAAIYLRRADVKTLPSSTALCLRRAALQGQPDNASLASRLGMHLSDVGLYDEARWALEHSISIQPDPETTQTLVRVLRRMGHGEEAARLIASAHQQDLYQTLGAGADQRRSARPRIPEITELSPADFAALSKSVIPVSHSNGPATSTSRTDSTAQPAAIARRTPATLIGARTNVTRVASQDDAPRAPAEPAVVVRPDQEPKPGIMRRLLNTLKPRSW